MRKFCDFQDFLKLSFFYAIYLAVYGHEFSKKTTYLPQSENHGNQCMKQDAYGAQQNFLTHFFHTVR